MTTADKRRTLQLMITFREIEDDDLLTWELQFRREGTLPAEIQQVLLEAMLDRPINIERTNP